jgi:hypothetical protein
MAVEALRDPSLVDPIQGALVWLAGRQRQDGSWPLSVELDESSWTTSLAVLALCHHPELRPCVRRGVDWLLCQEGRGGSLLSWLLEHLFARRRAIDQDPNLKGWPWTPGAFSWVEPTAYALMALKRARPQADDARAEARIREAELMIYDRMCAGGGWNYGNSRVLGEDLWPYPDATAVALIALQDHATRDANRQSLHALRKMLETNDSGLTLSWSVLCLQLYGHEVLELRRRLEQSFEARAFLGESRALALAVLALARGADRFRV